MKKLNHSAFRVFQPSAFRLSGFSLAAFRLSGFFLAAFGLQAFSLFCTAQTIIESQDCNQFRTTLANGEIIYILRDTGTYYQNPGSWFFHDRTFTNSGTDAQVQAAVYVQGNGPDNPAVFTGSNILVLGTGTTGNLTRSFVVYDGGVTILTSSTIRQDNPNADATTQAALLLSFRARFTGADLLVAANGPRINAVWLDNSVENIITLDSALVQNTGSAAAFRMDGNGVAVLTSSTISTSGAVAPGLQVGGGRPRFTLDGGLIHTTGANSPGLWLGSGGVTSLYGNGIMQFEGRFIEALIRADDGMGIDVNTNLPGLISRPTIANQQSYWFGNYDLTLVSSTISGAHGAIRMTSSSTSGAIVAEIPTKMRLELQDSALEGDVFVNDRAQFILAGSASRLDGALRLSGAAPIATVSLTDSSITGGIVLSGGAALDLTADNTTITGTLAAGGNSTAKVLLTGGSTLDAVALDDSATLELTLDNTSRVLGEFSIQGGATYTLLPADNRALVFPNALTLAAGGNLRVAPGTRLTLTSPLTFADPTATVTLADVRGDDLVLAAGLTGKGQLVVQGFHADILGQPEIRVIRDDTNSLGHDTFALASSVSNRLFAYHALENRPDGAYLTGGGFSAAGAAILDTPALAIADFFDTFYPVSRHLSGLRENSMRNENPRHAAGDSGAIWFSARTGATSVSAAANGLDFRQQTSALTVGADLRWGGARYENTFTAGLFSEIGYARRDFDNDASGSATNVGAGLYTLYQHTAGWHAVATARVEDTKNTLDSGALGAALSAKYSTQTAGLALEFGWRLPGFSPTKWWAEPSLGIGFARLRGATYDTRSATALNNFTVEQDSATATQARAQVAFGSDLGKKWSFRGRFAGSHLNISGGGITGGGVTNANFMLDGFRAEATLGLVRYLGRNSRLWLDCDTVIANGYKRPWTLTLGYAKAW